MKEAYKRNETVENNGDGLKTTQEQVSDVYMEGTIDGVINNVNGRDLPLAKNKKK